MKEEQQNTLVVFLVLGFGFMIGRNWPNIKKNLEPFLKTIEKQYGDITFETLGGIMGQKEIFDDMFAEWKDDKKEKQKKTKFKRKKNKIVSKKRVQKTTPVGSKTTS